MAGEAFRLAGLGRSRDSGGMERLALIGFGEAARAFAPGLSGRLSAYDPKAGDLAMRDALAAAGIVACASARGALAGAGAALSLVTADQTLAAAQAADGLAPGAFWFDLNSVAPATKTAAAAAIADRGGRYVDVAVMAPVHPRRLSVPLLASGPDAAAGAALLRALGFADVTVVAGPIGAAAAIKMIRSVMVKGIEALSAECMLAAEAAGVRDAVIGALDASWPGAEWSKRFDYNLERMATHGLRRAAEMEEVVVTLEALGTGSAMSRATVDWQRRMAA